MRRLRIASLVGVSVTLASGCEQMVERQVACNIVRPCRILAGMYRSIVPLRHRYLPTASLLVGVALSVLLIRDSAYAAPTLTPHLRLATFAGGCFWCMEAPFDGLDGVVSTTSGYAGGTRSNPTYEEVSAGGTGHAEAVQIVYDPEKISYEKLLDVFWHNVDPVTPNRQFCDAGDQYRTAIFFHDEEQQRLAEASKEALDASKRLHPTRHRSVAVTVAAGDRGRFAAPSPGRPLGTRETPPGMSPPAAGLPRAPENARRPRGRHAVPPTRDARLPAEVEAVELHHLGPCRHEVGDKLAGVVVLSVNLGQRP